MMKRLFGQYAVASATLCAACLPAAAQESAAEYPSRAITVVVSFAPGGPSDVVARVVGQSLSEILGKPVVIENKPGGGTSIGTAHVVKSAPDGYTLLAVDQSLTIMPLIIANLSYDPIKEIRPISLSARSVLTLAVANNVPANSAGDLVALSKKDPNALKFAHSGIGSPPHLGALALMQAADLKAVLVSYRGAGPAVQDIVAGHISMLMTAPSTTVQLTLEKKIKMLGHTGAKRLTAVPDVPTLREQGIKSEALDEGVWFGFGAPAATRSDIVMKLNAAILKAVADPVVREKLAKVDVTAEGSTPEELEHLIKQQSVTWADTLKRAGVKPE